MLKNVFVVILLVCFCMSSASCATIISGRMQEVPVVSTPSGAMVTIIGENVSQQTPATLTLDRRKGVYQIRIEKEGYKPVEITLKKGMNGWVWGNIVCGGIIGLIVDISTGAASKFEPTEVDINMVQQKLAMQGNSLDNKDILLVKLSKS